MPEIAVTSLDPRQQKLVDNARIALERGQTDYALDACGQILKSAPGCLAVRRLQRVAQLRDFRSKNKFMAKALGGFSTAPFMFGGGKKEPAKLLETAEGLLVKDPTSVAALRLLAEAAVGLGLPETAAFALDAVRELEPENRANLLALGEAWIAAGKPAEAVKTADLLLKQKPADAEAQALLRKASVAQTVTKGNWETQGNFRDKLRDEAQAISLEQAAKVVTAGDMAQRLADEAVARALAEPTNLNHYRAAAQAYRQLGRSDEALAWVRKARSLPSGAADPALEKEESELQTTLLEVCVAAATEEALAGAQAELAAWKLTEAKRTVERYPNDFPARLTLGELLLAMGQVDAALAQFQQAQKGPQVRVAALVGLGRGFKAKKIFDLAVMQFLAAKAELTEMNDAKKEVVYELGGCYEAMGKGEEAIAEFKAIYGEDIGFRDVGEKITAHYSR
ncbi:MAG: tetratricopeptide repeat protein [Undibacterium sp.]|nr:tetratricopeptide repeat protein [Opitutaceae bacterium]